MKVLIAHNHYQQPGGEDIVFAAERDLLRRRGVEVIEYVEHNDRIQYLPRARVALDTIWSRESRQALAALLRQHRPDVAHFHNTFPLVSPSAYYACRAAGVAVVQTLHNYRLLCPASTLFRAGAPCEACVGRRLAWPGIMYGCYRGDRLASAAVATMVASHRLLGTWQRLVHVYIALSPFSRHKFIEGGLPADRITVKSNFVHPEPSIGLHEGGHVLFVGRLVPEKGVTTLLNAWRLLGGPARLRIVGDGPLWRLADGSPPGVEWLGQLDRAAVLNLMRDAVLLVMPSEWYEGQPLTILEAFATGLPVVVSRLGSLADIVEDRRTGLHFTPGDPADLAAAVAWALAHPTEMRRMGSEARSKFEAEYTADRNYECLMKLYRLASARATAAR